MPDYIFPLPFETRMKATLGGEWTDFARAHIDASPVSIRVNPTKGKGLDANKIPWSDFGYYLSERPAFTLDPTFHAGAYYVQEASSMFLEQALKQSTELDKPLRVLDLSAAPGGKSTHLLSLINQDSLLVANEVIRSRAQILSENIQKWGCANVIVTNSDPQTFQKLPGYFDVIVVDAPCSGEGLFRKDADAAKEWSEDNINLCSLRQRRILTDVWPSLKENGVLIYSTCTYNAKENEENLAWLAENHAAEFVNLSVKPEWRIEEIKVGQVVGYRFYPHRLIGEGFFLSVIRKTETETSIRIRSGKNFSLASKKISDQLIPWINDANYFRTIRQEDLLIQIPDALYDDMGFISSQLHTVSKGTAIAEIKHEKLIPEHAIALSSHLNKEYFPAIELTLDQALAYLRKDNLLIGEGKRGFALVTYNGNVLGWINQLGNRINNLYPSAWRIRMSANASG
jgi:16S rRNA C967 or C1407 C5-methylase (RsmB/RsmF family)/NOL1/NOP2/fmu family ribosome biogenesis protein